MRAQRLTPTWQRDKKKNQNTVERNNPVGLFVSYLNGLNVTRHLLTIIRPSMQPVITSQNERPRTSLLPSRRGSWREPTTCLCACQPAVHSGGPRARSKRTLWPEGAAKRWKVSFSKCPWPCWKITCMERNSVARRALRIWGEVPRAGSVGLIYPMGVTEQMALSSDLRVEVCVGPVEDSTEGRAGFSDVWTSRGSQSEWSHRPVSTSQEASSLVFV